MSVPAPEDRLRRLLGGDDVAWLVRRARDRLAAGRPLTGPVTLPAATAAQRQAVSRLTGRAARPGASLSVSLDAVDAMLRSSGAAPGGLAEAVTLLTGPVRDLAAERADAAAEWTAAFAPLDAAISGRPELAAWRAWLDSTGVVRRLASGPADAGRLLSSVAAVVRRLPSRGVPIGRLAAECCGDAHALDDGRPAGSLALSAVRALAGLPFASSPGADTRRSCWAAVGVHLDELSSLVLCLGLPGDSSPLGAVLGTCRDAGQPASLTLRQLRCHAPVSLAPAAGLVRICENPVVVAAAADELGASSRPLVCVSGQPSAAAWRLLELLAAGGASFAYHGDFDWGGVRIAEAVRKRVGWRPWRYDRAAYAEALSRGGGPLTGRPAATPWDPGLAAAMEEKGLRAEEELALDPLLSDLGS
ncbi:MAG: TIGR02679 family protein [Streptosporangiales bacterium]|nr:TIGR02679 family protein [Streptosporangiales bacterium]